LNPKLFCPPLRHFTFPKILRDLDDAAARELHPNQGRWISPDPAGLAAVDLSNPQTWNRYAYVTNAPLNAVDPLGLDSYDNLHAQKLEAFGSGGSCFTDPYCSITIVNGIQVPNAVGAAMLDMGNGAGGGRFWALSDQNGHWGYAGFTVDSNCDRCDIPVIDWIANFADPGTGTGTNIGIGPIRANNVERPKPLKDISPCLQKAQQTWNDARSTYLGEIGLGALGTAIMTALAFVPGGAEVEGGELLHLVLHGGPAAAPGPVLMFHGAMKLDQAYHDYLNQTANCTP